MLRPHSFTTRLLGASLCTGLLSVSVSTACAQDAIGGVNPPKGGTVRTDKDPLRRRSATENIVFGQLVSVDEHRLTLREGEGDSVSQTVYQLSPTVRVYSGEREIKLSDLPSNSRIRFQRVPETDKNTVITELYAVENDDAADAGSDGTIKVVTSQSPVGFGLVLTTESNRINVVDVREGSPAANAGVKPGDQLVSLDDTVLVKPEDLFDATARMQVDDRATITVRRGEEDLSLSMLAAGDDAARDSIQTGSAPQPTRVVGEGDRSSNVSTDIIPPVELGATLETTPKGVAVVRVDQISPLADAGVLPGDYIKQAAGQGVATPEGLFRILNKFDGGSTVELNIVRNDTPMEFGLTLPDSHKKVLVETSANTAPRGAQVDRTRSMRTLSNDHEDLLRQILQNQQRQQAQLNYLNEAMQRLAQASGVGGGVLGVAPFGFGFGQGDGNGGCFCAIGFNPQGNPVIGFLEDGTAVAVVSYTADGTPILAGTTLGSREVVADGLTDRDQNGDGLPDGPDSRSAANANAGADSNCVCPVGVDVNGNPIVGVTQRGVPVAVVSTNANGNPILAETQFANDNAGGNPPVGGVGNPADDSNDDRGRGVDDRRRGVDVPIPPDREPRLLQQNRGNRPAPRPNRGNNPVQPPNRSNP